MQPNTRPYYMVSGWQFPWAFNAWRCVGLEPRNISNKWRLRCQGSENGGLSQRRPQMSARFEGLEFHHVARENNQAADILVRIGAKRDPVPPNIFLERLFKPSVVWEGDTGNNSPDPAKMPDTEHSDIIGGSATEITPSAHVIMAIIAP